MPTDKIKDVYDLISDKGYFTDENEFRSYVNDPKKIKEVYSLIQDDGFFKDEKEFEGYFSDVKKKEPAIGLGYEKPSEALRMGGLPKQEKLSQSPLKIAATTTPSVSTKKQWTQQDQKSLIEKIKNGDLTGQTPEEDDYLSRIGNRIVRGMNTLNYNLSKTPEFVYNLAAYPQNVIAETFDIPALAASADKVKQELGIQNEVADYYKDQINQLASLDDKYMGAKGSVTTLAKEGKYLDAAKLLGEQIAESLPTTAAIAASGGLGASSTAITLGGGAVFGAAKYDELADRTDLTESQKTSISFATGLTEGLFENLGTGNIGRIVKDVITKQGAAQGKEVAKGMFVTAYKDALKKYMPVSGALSEGIEEAGTQFAQNAIDIYTGVDPQKKLTDGLIDAFAVGTGSGLVISSPALLSKDRNKKVAEKQVEVDEIDSEINNPNLSDDAKATLAQKRGKIMSDINDVIDEDVNEQRALPDATKREIEQIQDGLEQIGIDIENTKSEFAKKELESKRVELESRIDELTKAGTTTTDGERTIEGAVSTGTDVAKEGLGVAAEPGKEGVAGEDIQAEKVRKEVVEAFGDDAKDLEDFYYESKRNGTNKEFVDEYESMFPPKETQQKIEIEKSNEIEKESNNKIINGEADPIVSKIVSEHTFTDEDNNLIDKERGDLDRDSFINKKIKEIISGSKLVSDKIKKALAPIVDKLKKIIIGISIVSSVGVGKQVSSYQPINNIISEKISSDIANVVKMPYSDIANIGTNAIQKFLEIGDYADTESTLGLETSVDMTGVKESNIPSIGEKDVIIGEATSTTKDSKYKIKPYIINLLSDSVKIKLADNKFKKNRKPFKDQKNSLGIMGSTNGIILFKEASDYQKSLGIQMVYDEKTSKIVPKMNSDVAPNDIVFLTSEGIAIPIDDLDMKPNNNGGFDIKKGKDNENGTAILLKKDGNSFHIGWAAKADEAPSFVSTEKAKEFKILRGGMVWLYSTDGEVAVAVSGSLNDIFSEYKRLQEKNPNKKFILFRGDTGSYSTPAFTETNETTADDVSKYSTRNTYGNNVHLVLMKPDAPLDKGLPVGEMGLSPLLALALLKRKKGLSITKEEQDLIDNREKQKQYETKKETPQEGSVGVGGDAGTSLLGVKYSDIIVDDKYLEDILSDNKLSEEEKKQVRDVFARAVDYFKFDKEGEQKFQEKFANPEDITDVADIITGLSAAQQSAFSFYNTKNYENVKDAVNYIANNPNEYSPKVVKAVKEIKEKLDNPSSSMSRLYAIDVMKELGISEQALKETPTAGSVGVGVDIKSKVYHGGGVKSEKDMWEGEPLFVSKDKSQAHEYTKGNNGEVVEFLLDNKKIATEEDARKIIAELGLQSKQEGWNTDELNLFELIDPTFETALLDSDIKKVFAELENKGYEGIEFTDTNLKTLKQDIQNIVVFNPKKTFKAAEKQSLKETPTAEKTVTTTDVSEDLKDVESTAKALEEAVKSNPILSKDLSENDNVVYHGTGAEVLLDFIKTDKEKTYQEKSTSWSKSTQGFGKFWTKSKDNASSHIDHRLRNDGTGTVVHAVYASKNPFKVKDVSTLITKSKEHWASIGGDKNALASTINKAYKDKLIKDGYDAITFKEGTSQMPTSRKFAADVFVPLKDFPIQVATQEYGSRNAGAVSDVKINYNQISEAYQADKAANKETPLTKTVEKILGQPKAEAKPTEAAKVEPAKETAKPTKTERKVIAEAKIDDLAAKAKEFLRNKNLPEGTQVSGVSQDKVIDILASTVKALVNSGIEISEAIKQVREYFEQDFDTSGIKDYEIAQAIARDELTDAAKENGFSSYREAVFAVNKYVREVGKEDVITKAEIEKAKEAKDKEAEAPKKGYTSKKKQAQEGEKEPVIKETGRSKSYEEGRVPVSEAYNDVVNAQKEYYEQMNRKEELANAEGYLASFGNTEEGLLDAYIDMMEVFRTNPYLDPKNSIAIEILADRMFAMAIDYRDKGQTDKYNNFLEKSEKLRKEAFQAHFRAGQYTSAVAVFSRSANPDAFLIFVEGQQAQEFEKAKKSKPEKIKEYEAAVNDFYEKAKEIKKDAARQAVVSAPNSTTKVNVKLSDKLKARYEQGKARQAEALKKLGKINFFGSSGLSNEAIEAVGELVLSQFEQGIYKAATIIERIIEITEGKLTEKNIKDVYDAYKVNYKGEKLTLTELEEVLRKEEIAEKEPATDIDKALEKEREKLAKIKADYEQAVVDKADALVLKRAQQFVKDQEKKVKEQEDKAKKAATAKTAEGKRPTLSDLIQRELEADSTKEQIAKELVEKGGLSEREANKLAEIYYNKYRKILKEKITSQLLKDLTPKKVKQIEAQMNALKDKPYGKTLGGMIANQVAAGALDSEILRAAFAEKYGLPNISPVQADIIRDLARKARAAKTQLGLQTANKNLLEYVNSFVKPKYGSLLGTLYYMGLLTGVSTAAVNTFGNVNGLINQSTENFVQSVIEAIQGNKGNLMSSSKPAQKILMAIANMNDSLSAAIDILIHGGGESRYSNIKKDAFGEITTEDLIVKRKDFKDLGFKKLFTTLFKLYKTPPALFIRNLPASDEGFTMANFNMEATRELRKKLYAEGYRGADLEKKVYEQVYGTTEIKAKALQEAIKELKRIGIDPANRKILANRIAKEIIANSLDEKVQNVANEVAKENTFRGKPRGMAGYLSRKIPQTWLISPFVTTPSRILEKHMNYIPLYGILRYYRGGISDTLRKAFPGLEKDFVRKGIESSKREGELRNKQLAQVLATHALLLVFWGLSQIDWEDEKGNVVPFVDASAGYMGTDIEERKRLEELMPAYMIRIGNFKFSYKTNPLLAMIALPLGVIKDAERSFEAADYSKSAFAYNFELFNFLYESNPIEGYQDFFEGLSKSFRTIKEEMTLESIAALPVKVAADFSSNVAVDNFYKQIVDFTDPLVHEAQDLMEVIYKAFNMEKIGDLTPTHDRWGRPVKRYPGESFFPLQHLFNNNDDKKITEWEIKNGIEIPTINRKTLVLTNNTLKTEKQIKNQREELVKDYGLTSDEVKYFDEALNSDFKLLTKDEWNKMSETIRYDVFTIIKNNFDNATEEYKKFYKESINSEERNIKPISKLSRPDAKKLVEILFKIKKREYINNNFTKIE